MDIYGTIHKNPHILCFQSAHSIPCMSVISLRHTYYLPVSSAIHCQAYLLPARVAIIRAFSSAANDEYIMAETHSRAVDHRRYHRHHRRHRCHRYLRYRHRRRRGYRHRHHHSLHHHRQQYHNHHHLYRHHRHNHRHHRRILILLSMR